ncbi:hypothetical protein SAMN05216420_12215 [Nitrosospira sp. Nl5]|nr:hypothetical protein SAMN05216420_12215 [Nitrosospira sp. Nl5]
MTSYKEKRNGHLHALHCAYSAEPPYDDMAV